MNTPLKLQKYLFFLQLSRYNQPIVGYNQLGYTLSEPSIFFRVLASNILIYSKNIISIP